MGANAMKETADEFRLRCAMDGVRDLVFQRTTVDSRVWLALSFWQRVDGRIQGRIMTHAKTKDAMR